MLSSALIAFHVYFVTYFAFSRQILTPDGKGNDLWIMSQAAYMQILVIPWIILFIDTNRWTLFTLFSYVLMTLVLYFPGFVIVFDEYIVSYQQY